MKPNYPKNGRMWIIEWRSSSLFVGSPQRQMNIIQNSVLEKKARKLALITAKDTHENKSAITKRDELIEQLLLTTNSAINLRISNARNGRSEKPDAMRAALRRVIATNLILRNELEKRGANALKQPVDGTIKELAQEQQKLVLEKQTQIAVVDDDTETKQIAKVD
ncbi:hypothetical protein RFI_39336 [Reticulomyxa filosa]|uniref:Uncharacterized protein n=1 Tax=Reticulomyxa filosa TaxID=46433 RepID=X6L9G6_RETFI|nr:hypothetical protein RFI_39336 [Reticulomyxa filosa]|eukprot:ETN98178.1 hypothetical protein RFI_39336 [Reticulomyxa filosa]